MQKSARLLIALLLAVLSTWVYATPWLTLRQMHDALERQDAAALSAHVDYPALRSSLKQELQGRIQQQGGAGALLGSLFGNALLNPMIDALLTPQGLQTLFDYGRLERDSQPARQPTTETPPAADKKRARSSWHYTGLNHFVLSVENEGKPGLQLLFSRHGLSDWKLDGISLPQ